LNVWKLHRAVVEPDKSDVPPSATCAAATGHESTISSAALGPHRNLSRTGMMCLAPTSARLFERYRPIVRNAIDSTVRDDG